MDTAKSVAAGAYSARRSPPRALIAATRPRQWVKNLLVLAAPGAAGAFTSVRSSVDAVLAMTAFTAVASGVYLLNDAADVAEDRVHPLKCHRPVAAGEISVAGARWSALVMVVAGVVIGGFADLAVAGVLAVYAALNVAYSGGLRSVALADIVIVATGFVLRAVAGGVAVDVPLSGWFVIVVSVTSLMVVAGKRLGEMVTVGTNAGRATLRVYSSRGLGGMIDGGAVVLVAAYLVWLATSGVGEVAGDADWVMWATALPVFAAAARFRQVAHRGGAASPERLLLSDRCLMATSAVWCLLFTVGVYW
jgi:decaprenyl-phosphate phosphoribosyltransferase